MYQKKIKRKSTHFAEKIKIRLDSIKGIDELIVLDCYHGNGDIWSKIQTITGKEIRLLGIEKNASRSKFEVIQGDNRKVIKTIDLKKFNIIDLDSYSNPIGLIDYCYQIAEPGTIFFYTFIINPLNGGPQKLRAVGENQKICQTIGNKFISEAWNSFLYDIGVTEYKEYIFNDNAMVKRYGCFIKGN